MDQFHYITLYCLIHTTYMFTDMSSSKFFTFGIKNSFHLITRSTRSVEALTAFVKQQLSSSIQDFVDKKDLEQQMDKSKRNVIAYFADKNTDEYRSFQVTFLAAAGYFLYQFLSSSYDFHFGIYRRLLLFCAKIVLFGLALTKI